MAVTIDSAGRVVIPKVLRDRAGLTPGTRVDFRFHDGNIEISPSPAEVEWEQVGRIRYPVFKGLGLTSEEISQLIEARREQRLDGLNDASR